MLLIAPTMLAGQILLDHQLYGQSQRSAASSLSNAFRNDLSLLSGMGKRCEISCRHQLSPRLYRIICILTLPTLIYSSLSSLASIHFEEEKLHD